jgi:membrane protein YqaA with SNARE-associated domain
VSVVVEERSRAVGTENVIAALWGLAESTLFFLVPDVCLSFIALRTLRRGLIACAYATAGALVGGVLMYAWGTADPRVATASLDWVPAVSPGMIAGVEQALADRGPTAVLTGAFTGTPYKIYATKAAVLELSLPVFLLLSTPARLSRFLLAVLIVRAVISTAGRNWSWTRRVWTLAGFWTLFYAVFFALMPN